MATCSKLSWVFASIFIVNYALLDGVYLCICSFSNQLTSACEHLVSYLDCSDKQVVGTTYKDLHQLVVQVAESGFFDAVNQVAAEPAAETADTGLASDEADQPTEPEPAPVGNGKSPVYCQCCLVICCPFYLFLI